VTVVFLHHVQIISKLFHGLIAAREYFPTLSLKNFRNNWVQMTTKLFQPPNEFWNYFKIISPTMNVSENIRQLQ